MARSKRPEGSRNPNGEGTLYYSKTDGYWHARVTVGVLDNGKPDRRHVQRKNEGDAREEYRNLLAERDTGTVRKKGKPWTVATWLTHWVENIAPLTCRYKTLTGYQTAVYRHLIPGLGSHRLAKIEADHFEKLYAKMLASGSKPGTVHQVHRTARTAFGEAEKRRHVVRNVVRIAKAPRVEEEEIEPMDADEIQRILATALARRNGVRFVVALALGARQGEALGFKWSNLDTKRKTLRVRTQLQRQKWKHGCTNPHSCGSRHHKRKPCPAGCKRHTRACPPPCPENCTEHARMCRAIVNTCGSRSFRLPPVGRSGRRVVRRACRP